MEEFDELASLTYNICWEKVFIEKYILGSETVFNCFKHFSNKKDVEKCDYLAWMLNTYYKGFLNEKFKEYIKNEKYEMCSKLKNYVK